jgi:alpha-glucosidase (family GH31 glycosyl hydrolase)
VCVLLLLLSHTSIYIGTLDLTSPDAATWYSNVIRCNMLGLKESCTENTTESNVTGSFGWMADFGEYVPFDAVLHDGSPASTIHNRFPELWAKVNRDAVGDNDDVVYFMRSASLKSPGLARMFWAGDQLVSWDDHDGLKTVIRAHMSAGMSGMTISHSDCGGYTMVNKTKNIHLPFTSNVTINVGLKYLRTKQLLMRWMELSAFADTVLRTHLGNLPSDSWQVYSDNETMSHFATFTRVHSALAEYREKLMKDAACCGYPLVRHSYIVYPDDLQTRTLTDQFFLGDELLVAPVLDKDTKYVTVYLPENGTRWTHVWNENIYVGGSYVNVSADFGEPAVFHRTLSIEGIELGRKIRGAL